MFLKLISSKAIWSGITLVGVGIGLCIHGNIEAGITSIGTGVSTIAITAKIIKYGN